MKLVLLLFSVLSLLSKAQSGLTEEERRSLLKRVTKLASYNPKDIPLNQVSIRNSKGMEYEPSKIKEIINKYNFPESYNFIEAESAPVHIKDQGACGSCWAFASTTALAYRFFKKGIDVNLSPQHSISCYLPDCEAGDYLINSHFNLVKNGTVTEECFPYSSSYGVIRDTCPTQCKNGDDIVKYYEKNVYTTSEDYNQEKYYEIVTAIIDQLTTNGPVESAIKVYEDFNELRSSDICQNIIYKYDGRSKFAGGHAVVIVGYGVENNRYYWIIQNSWGEGFCANGFAKIEFGQIQIEIVSFGEPYIDDNSEGKDININIEKVNSDCKLKFSASSDMNGSFEVYYKSDSNFYYQCGPIYPNTNEGICSYSFDSLLLEKGTYKYISHDTLLNRDKYKLDFSSSSNQFYFYGSDIVDNYFITESSYYVSEANPHISLIYLPKDEGKNFVSKIYINKYSNITLSNCQLKNLDDSTSIIYCSLTSSEINYFSEKNNLPLAYDILCGDKEEMIANVKRFNSNRYPTFRIKNFFVSYDIYDYTDSIYYMTVDIEGSSSSFNTSANFFAIFARYERASYYSYELLICSFDIKDKLIFCVNDDYLAAFYYYDNVYLTPYYFPAEGNDPYQVIIQNEIKGEKMEEDDDYDDYDIIKYMSSKYKNFNLLILFMFVICLF